jgi:Nuclease-related domain
MRERGWHIVHSLEFEHFGDIDHVAVGPAGVLAIESKWTNVPWFVDGDRLVTRGRDPIRQARAGARKIRLFLGSKDVHVDVSPVVIAWGPGAAEGLQEPQTVNGVLVLKGTDARAWLPILCDLTNRSVDGATAKGIYDRLVEYVANHPDS